MIDHNPRKGEKIEFTLAEAIRCNERTAAERSNARLKDEFAEVGPVASKIASE